MGFLEVVAAVLVAMILFYGVLVAVGYTVLKKHFSRQIEEILHPPFVILPENMQNTGNIYDSQGVVFEPTTPDVLFGEESVVNEEPDVAETLADVPNSDDDPTSWPVVTDLWVDSRLGGNLARTLEEEGCLIPQHREELNQPPVYRIRPDVMQNYDEEYRLVTGAYG